MKVGVRHRGSSGRGALLSNISEHFRDKTDFFLVPNESCTTQAQTVFANHGEKKI